MTTLSIVLPEGLAKASQEVAKQLGVSRTQFIRQAVMHEIKNFETQLEQQAIIQSILAMKQDENYIQESESITSESGDDFLPDEEDEWWKKK